MSKKNVTIKIYYEQKTHELLIRFLPKYGTNNIEKLQVYVANTISQMLIIMLLIFGAILLIKFTTASSFIIMFGIGFRINMIQWC